MVDTNMNRIQVIYLVGMNSICVNLQIQNPDSHICKLKILAEVFQSIVWEFLENNPVIFMVLYQASIDCIIKAYQAIMNS